MQYIYRLTILQATFINYWISKCLYKIQLTMMVIKQSKQSQYFQLIFLQQLQQSLRENRKLPAILKNYQYKFITKLSFNNYFSGKHKLGDHGIDWIVQAQLPFITDLELINNNITHRGVAQMRKCKWKGIELILLSQNPLKNIGVKELVINKWKSLKCLCLSNIGLTDDGAKILSKVQWSKLQQLGMMSNHLTHQVCNHLIRINQAQLPMSWTNPSDSQQFNEYQKMQKFHKMMRRYRQKQEIEEAIVKGDGQVQKGTQ